jgi:hypothetical protein
MLSKKEEREAIKVSQAKELLSRLEIAKHIRR